MARQLHKLTALAVARAVREGIYYDGGGLELQVTASGARSWVFRYQRDGRRREMGLGGAQDVALAKARQKAAEARAQLAEGIDPLDKRREALEAKKTAAMATVTFKDAALRYIAANTSSWRNPKSAPQWRTSLETYAFPVFGDEAAASVTSKHVIRALDPIWTVKNETARKVRGRIELILDWARVRGYRSGENPARWKGELEHTLPKRSRAASVRHFAALPYRQMAKFMAELRQQKGMAAKALEFTILTAARTSEAIGARADEFDLDNALWNVPGDRIKAGRPHRVPLSPRALEIAREMIEAGNDEYVFPGRKAGRPLTNMAMSMLLRDMGHDDITVHGFRSAFRDWAAELTNHPRDVAEMALAHAVGNAVEQAYRRGDLFEKRRLIMADWEQFCARLLPADGAVVVPMQSRRVA